MARGQAARGRLVEEAEAHVAKNPSTRSREAQSAPRQRQSESKTKKREDVLITLLLGGLFFCGFGGRRITASGRGSGTADGRSSSGAAATRADVGEHVLDVPGRVSTGLGWAKTTHLPAKAFARRVLMIGSDSTLAAAIKVCSFSACEMRLDRHDELGAP